jgi:pimeloyl-ACP methyl ester carboxylesterase
MEVDVDGGRLEVAEQGRGPVIVLIHGSAPAVWGELPVLLAAERRVITYDRRSFGANRHLPAGDLSGHAADAAAIVRAVGAPAMVVGWSIGGVIALELAACHPELLSGLVLIEPPLHAKRHPRPRMLSALIGAILLGKLGRPDAGARRFLRWALGRTDGGQDFDRMAADWHRQLAAGDAAAVVRELAAGTGEHLDEQLIGRIIAPTHVIHGDRSQTVFAAAAVRVAKAIPDATLSQATGSGRALQLDAPALITACVSGSSATNDNVRAPRSDPGYPARVRA